MKKIIQVFVLFTLCTPVFAQSDNKDTISSNTEKEILPEFPGGEDALYKFISENLKYPQEAKKNRIEGIVLVEFIVEKDGYITNVKATKSPNELLSEEAERVVKMSPKWTPGYEFGKPVRLKLAIPIQFALK